MSSPTSARKADVRKLFNAVEINLEARFMTSSKDEHPCRIVEMSTAEITFETPIKPDIGDMVVVYIKELGRFEGIVEHHSDAGFSISMSLTKVKHTKLAEQLVWFSNREALGLPESRRHKRIVPLMQWTTVKLNNGKEKMAKINDISISGVSIEANISVLNVTLIVGGRITVGSRAATVLRVFPGGFVATFDHFIDEGDFDETIRL